MDNPQITLSQIRARADGKVFSRGESYYHQGAIRQTIQRNNMIEGRCEGSYPQPYRVQVEFSDSEIVSTRCNCQYDWGGDCKHIVALLLTYYHEPEQFEEKPPVDDALADRSKEDLIYIIQQMVTRYPDLQSIIDLPSPTQVVEGTVEMDTTSIRQQLRETFNGGGSGYYDYDEYDEYGTYNVGQVQEIQELAKRFATKGDWLSASQVYRAILEEFAQMEQDYYNDYDGSLAEEINHAVSELATCLEQDAIKTDDKERQAIFNAMLDVDIWDTEIGGFDIGWESREIIVNHATPDDIPMIRKRIEEVRDRQRKMQYGQWQVESYTRFLMELDLVDEVDPEVTLQNLRNEGMYELLIRKLLELGRIGEATRVVKKQITGPYEMLKVANLFSTNDQSHIAQQLVEDYLGKHSDDRLTYWLIDHYKEQKNTEQTLHWQRVLMRQQPSVTLYEEIKANAHSLNQWDTIQSEIISDLKDNKRFALLIKIYLLEEEWELAWQTLPYVSQDTMSWLYRDMQIEVADATRHVMPDRAISVYKDHINRLIGARGRDNYQRAATLLVIVRQLYRDLKEHETWNHLIQHIRTEHKRLPALQDELNKAGL